MLLKLFIKNLFFTLILSSLAYSQSLKGLAYISQPYAYRAPTGEILEAGTGERASSPWEVYSDRVNNKTYKTPNGNQVAKRIKFMESFYVADEKGEYLHLAKDPNIGEGIFSDNVEDYGWIHREQILLWDNCLVTKVGKVYKKAMILNTIDHIKNAKKGKPDLVKFYETPKAEKERSESRLFEVFYVFKRSGNFLLLGKDYALEVDYGGNYRGQRDNSIVGWADISRLTLWNQRVAIEPNYEGYSERVKKKRKAIFFSDKNSAKEYRVDSKKMKINWDDCAEKSDSTPCNKLVWGNDNSKKRWDGAIKRFPVLETDDDIIKAGIMGEVYEKNTGEKLGNSYDTAIITQKIEKIAKKLKNINIMFLVDATSSMEEYFPAVTRAIEKTLKKLKNAENKINYAAAIYRDAAEKKELGGNGLYDEKVGSPNEVIDFLNNVVAKDVNDKDTPEAVLYGVNKVLRGGFLKEGQTNVLILIGDAGNNDNNGLSVRKSYLERKLSERGFNFLAFQVHNDMHESYGRFVTELKSVLHNSAMLEYEKNKDAYESANKKKMPRPNWVKKSFNYKMVGNGYFKSIRSCEKQGTISPEVISEDIVSFITSTNNRVEELKGYLYKMATGSNLSGDDKKTTKKGEFEDETPRTGNELGPGMINILKAAGLSDEQIKTLTKEKFQIYHPAYSSFSLKNLDSSPFTRVLLLSRDEVSELVVSLRRLSTSGSDFESREKLKKAWKMLLKSFDGSLTDLDMEKMNMKDIQEKVFGLPGASASLLGKYQLSDITNESKLPSSEMDIYINSIRNKAKRLNSIFNTVGEYEYGFLSSGKQYYWIEEGLLP